MSGFRELLGQKVVVTWKDKTEDVYTVHRIDMANRMIKLDLPLETGALKRFWVSLNDIAGIGLVSEDSRYAASSPQTPAQA